jgi:hypothetical protein
MELPPSTHDPQAVRELADRILADPRYDRPGKSIPDRILEWIGEQLGKVIGSAVGSGAGTIVFWLVLLATVAFVGYLVVRHGRVVRLPGLPSRERPVMVELTRTPTEWLQEAAALEAAGRWREGLRCRHRALIGELVRQGAVREQAGRTAREHVGDVAASRPAAASDLAAATELFEAAWYGDVPTGADESARFQSLAARVREAATTRSHEPAAAGA